MSRYLAHSIIWSFPSILKDFQQTEELKASVVKILDKNCEKYLFAEELGSSGSNYHYDITAVFNKPQKGYEIKLKLKGLQKIHSELYDELYDKPAIVINHLKDEDAIIRAGGYGSKEGNIYKIKGFTNEELESGQKQYSHLKAVCESAKRVRQIGAKFFCITVEKYIVSNQKEIKCGKDLTETLIEMIDNGYVFDMSPKTATNLYHQYLKTFIGGDDSAWKNFFENGIDISESLDLRAKHYQYKQKMMSLI